MADLLIQKYEPTTLKEIIGNNNNVLKINHWIKNFSTCDNKAIIISGNHGVGKGVIIKIILNTNNYYYKWLHYHDDKSKDLLKDLQNSAGGVNMYKHFIKDNKRFALVIDDIEKITLKNEKKQILELLKFNNEHKLFPIIFISNLQHNKLLKYILEYSKEYKIYSPVDSDMLIILNKIIGNENILIDDKKCKNKIIKFCQNDIRRLISVLYELKNSFNELITYENFKDYLETSLKKNKDTSLFEATKLLIDEYKNINNCIHLYNIDKVLVPLTIHENFYRSLMNRYTDNTRVFDSLKNVSQSISFGDVIETNIYTDQNWFLHDIHGFYTCAKTSYHINKHKPKYKKNAIPYYEMGFSSDLNQTSLKNINKKQITNLQKSIFPNKSFYDIILLGNIVYQLVSKNKMEELHNIISNYDKSFKIIETLIKIDKTLPKISFSVKSKRKYRLYD